MIKQLVKSECMFIKIATSLSQNTMYILYFPLNSLQIARKSRLQVKRVLCQVDLQIKCTFINDFTCIFAFSPPNKEYKFICKVSRLQVERVLYIG